MLRFFALSVLLHVAFFFLVCWKNYPVIEDPVVSVSVFQNQSNALTQKNKISAHAEKKSNSKSTSPQDTKAALTAKPTTSELKTVSTNSPENLNQENTVGQNGNNDVASGGTVSVKPRVIRQFKARYPDEAKSARIEGTVKLSVLIDTNGHVQDVSILEGPGYGLNETAKEALEKFIFSPAEKLGEKVPVRIVYVYRFRLEAR